MTTCPHCGVEQTDCGHCGKPLSNRSESDHRRFFGLVRAAFHHWPEGHEFAPDNAEHLRAYLLCKAGYRTVTTIPVEDDATPAMMTLVMLTAEAAIKAARTYAFTRPHGQSIAVFTAKSINWATLSQKAFNDVRDAVTEVIESETGQTAETLLRETEKAA